MQQIALRCRSYHSLLPDLLLTGAGLLDWKGKPERAWSGLGRCPTCGLGVFSGLVGKSHALATASVEVPSDGKAVQVSD